MGLVLWIDQNTFATGLLEKVFKKKNLPFYTLQDAKDFVYIVEDLKPGLLVLDKTTALNSLDSLKTQYEASKVLRELPVIVIGEGTGLDFISNKVGILERPFDPFMIPNKLEEILKVN